MRQQHALLQPGDYSCFSEEANIHRLASTSARSVLFSLVFPSSLQQEKSFYFPVNPLQQDQAQILAYRAQHQSTMLKMNAMEA
ncbi:hypothetical protein BOW51_00360 [Solemya velesiana gill symbiont]|uniref:Uncharacterized protein n=1 Tax=Solemya velesiana gill symbiont TaxID=1918948 RepID=A0A1T2KYN2_9GAMM|nr:hypothetical protein BOW51_00360 [Solemya velesiana gill symbiont]